MREKSSQSELTRLLNVLFELVKFRIETLRMLPEGVQTDGLFNWPKKHPPAHEAPKSTLIEERHLLYKIRELDRSLNSVASCYSRAWNYGFANDKQAFFSLPPELQLNIFDELVGEKTMEFRRRDQRLGWELSVQSGSGIPLRTESDYPHYFRSDYMGPRFAGDLSVQFHKVKDFHLQHPNDLKKFLSHDRFHTTCEPAKFVQFFTINISTMLFSHKFGGYRRWSSSKFDQILERHFVDAIEGLKHLKSLVEKNKGVKHTLCLRVDCRTHGHGPKFAEVLFPLVYDLKDQGWNVHFQNDYGPRRNHSRLTAIDFDYNKPRTEWTNQVRSNSAFANDDPDSAMKKQPFTSMHPGQIAIRTERRPGYRPKLGFS